MTTWVRGSSIYLGSTPHPVRVITRILGGWGGERSNQYLPILRDLGTHPYQIEAIFQSTELLQSLPLSEEEIRQKVGVDEKSTLRLGIWGAPEIPYKQPNVAVTLGGDGCGTRSPQ